MNTLNVPVMSYSRKPFLDGDFVMNAQDLDSEVGEYTVIVVPQESAYDVIQKTRKQEKNRTDDVQKKADVMESSFQDRFVSL